MASDEMYQAAGFDQDCQGNAKGSVTSSGQHKQGEGGDHLATHTGLLDSTLGSSQTLYASPSGASTATSSRRGTLERGEAVQDGVPSKDEICFDFTKGLCTRGDKCKFTHDLATIVSVNSREKGICFDFLRPSGCHRGLLCRFSHDLSSIAQQCAQQSAQSGCSEGGQAGSAGGKPNKAICFDFVKGVCERGPECRYSHDLSLIARTGRGGPQSQRAQEVCYDFLRGRCDRGSACKYSHNTSLLAQPPSSNPLGASAHHPSRPYNFSPDDMPLDLLDPAALVPPGSSPTAASHPMPLPPAAAFFGNPLGGGGAGGMAGGELRSPPPAAALLRGAALPSPSHPLGPGPPTAHHVPFLPMHGASGFEPSIPLHLQHPGSYMRHHPHHPHPLHHPQGHDSVALAHSHAAVLHHLAVLQQRNQLTAAAAASAPFHHALYPLPTPSSNPWLAEAAAAAVSQPAPLPPPSLHMRENINAGAAAAAAQPPQQPSLLPPPQQPERAPLGALRDVSNILHQHPSSNTPAASQKQPTSAAAAKAATALKSSGGAGVGPAAAGSPPVSIGRLGSCSSSSSSGGGMGLLRAPSPFLDTAVAPAECGSDSGVGHREGTHLSPAAAAATAFLAPLPHGGTPPGNGGQGPAVWPLPHASVAPQLLGNSSSGGGSGSPLSVEAISAALAGLGNDPHALAHALSSLAAAVQAQADNASSPSFRQRHGPTLQQQLAHFLGPSCTAEDDLLGAKDQQLCGPPPPAPLHAFAAGFGHGNYSSSPVAGYGGGPFPPSSPHPASCPQKPDADAGDDGVASLAPDLLPLLQEIWNK